MRALLSVSDKTNLMELGNGLVTRGYELVSTGGTARVLAESGLSVTTVDQITGFPEMMDGRVKTLHPAVHGGILARRDRRDDLDALESHGIQPIAIVVVNLYPFARAAARPETTFDALIEEIDIGGPSMVRAAAKNFRDVIVVVDPEDYKYVLEELDRQDGPNTAFRFELARKAFAHTAAYDEKISMALSAVETKDSQFMRQPLSLEGITPDRLNLSFVKVRDLRYGENPHQLASLYAGEVGLGFGSARILQGKELSFNNLLDLDAAARLMLEFDEPAAAVIKHNNPCGVAIGNNLVEAYVRARETDPLSAFGGVIAVNRSIDSETAREITSTFIEAVVAPEVNEDAKSILSTKKALRVVTANFSGSPDNINLVRDIRSIFGGLLIQSRDRVSEAASGWNAAAGDGSDVKLNVVTERAPTDKEWKALRFAWRVCAHVKSNAVIFVEPDRTAAIGAGQMSRVDAVNVAVMKATRDLAGTVASSDAFFPFRDGLDAIAKAGATAVVQPGGSVRDDEVITAANEHGMAMVFTGRRHFRH